MYTTTKYWYGLINDGIDCSDAVVELPAADASDSIVSRDVDVKHSLDYG